MPESEWMNEWDRVNQGAIDNWPILCSSSLPLALSLRLLRAMHPLALAPLFVLHFVQPSLSLSFSLFHSFSVCLSSLLHLISPLTRSLFCTSPARPILPTFCPNPYVRMYCTLWHTVETEFRQRRTAVTTAQPKSFSNPYRILAVFQPLLPSCSEISSSYMTRDPKLHC